MPRSSEQAANQDRIRAFRAPTGAGIALAAALFGMGCHMRIDVVAERSSEPDASTPSSGGAMSDASSGAGMSDASGAGGMSNGGQGGTPSTIACSEPYPTISWHSPSGAERTVCTASFARDRMSNALCSCGNLAILGKILTDAIDSTAQRSASGSAAVGSNGDCTTPSTVTIGGSLTIASPTALRLPTLDVHGDLRLAGALTVAGPLNVARDAWFADSAAALSVSKIGRNVHQTSGKMLTSTIPSAIGGQLIAEDVSIAPPCRCGSDDTLNWLSVIDSASKQNDNDSIQLKSLATAPQQVVDLTLPCGRFYLSDLKGLGQVHLHVTGRTALFVAGDVASLGGLQVDLAPDAELDWFVGGKFDFGGGGQVGDASRPAALRIYVAGAASLILTPQNVAANLYAPLSDVVFLGGSDFNGSVFGHTVSNVADVTVHYDAAVQRVGDACPLDLPQSCSGCGECQAGQACVAGACTACRNDSDCCSPLVCSAGHCAAFLE